MLCNDIKYINDNQKVKKNINDLLEYEFIMRRRAAARKKKAL